MAGKYQEKKVLSLNIIKIALTIYMVSANGKIPAGSVNINPTLRILTENKLCLEKCPDRNACVYITQRF